jgi:cytolysin (calcineurin-like family phosphatase)
VYLLRSSIKQRRNIMLRQLISASALMLATVPAISLSAVALSAPKVTVFNQGGYVADYQINYTINGQRKDFKISSLVVGSKRTVTLPVGSRAITVRGQMQTGLFWEPRREIFNQSARDGSCFKTYGTIFKGEWSRDCTAAF